MHYWILQMKESKMIMITNAVLDRESISYVFICSIINKIISSSVSFLLHF